MKTLESQTDAAQSPERVITSRTPWHILWRPWYMKLWWGFTIIWNIAGFSVATDTVPGAWIFTFLLFPFAPLVPFIYQVLSSLREQVTFPWDSGYCEATWRGEWDHAVPHYFDEEEIAAESSRALTDPTDPRSGVFWIGHPLNPLNRHD